MSAVEHDALRRIRSTGDVPRRPDPIHRHQVSRRPDSHSDPLPQSRPGPGSSRQTPRIPSAETSEPLPELMRMPTPGELSRPAAQPAPHSQRSWFSKAMMFFGVGRGAPRERRTIVALYFTLCSGFVEVRSRYLVRHACILKKEKNVW